MSERHNQLQSIIEKCEQYWNEPNLGDAEIHAALECIHRWAREAAQHLKREQEPAPRYWNYDALPCAKCEGIHDGPCAVEGVGDDELANELSKAQARCFVLEAEIGRLTRGKPDCV